MPLDVDRDSWIDLMIPYGTLTDPERPVCMNDLVAQLAPADLTPLRTPLEGTAIIIAAGADRRRTLVRDCRWQPG